MKTIVTAGKGGTGKSVVLAKLLVSYLLPQQNLLPQYKRRILIVDADPHQSLTFLLTKRYEISRPVSLGDLLKNHAAALRSGAGMENMSRAQLADVLVGKALVQLPHASLLVMGQSRLPGCQCVVNTLLGNALDALQDRFDLVVLDNEAGVEPIGRHHTSPVNVLLLFSTPHPLDMDVAGQILDQAKSVGREIDRSVLIVNKIHPKKTQDGIHLPKTDEIITVPFSQGLEEGDLVEPRVNAALWNIATHIKSYLAEV